MKLIPYICFMNIKEFNDGYCLTHNNKDYMYSGKSENVINLISLKVKELLLEDRTNLINKTLREKHLI